MNTIPAPFSEYTCRVQDNWIDYNGHMNVGYYLVSFDEAIKPFFNWLGFTNEFRISNNSSTFALEAQLNFVRELSAGEEIRFESRLLDYDHKRVHFYQEMYHAEHGYLTATHESLGTYIDMSIRKTASMPDVITDRLKDVLEAHKALPVPSQVGHKIGIKR